MTSEHDGNTLAAIDVGTNSIHLVIVRTKSDRVFEVLEQEKDVVRLGSGSGDMNRLDHLLRVRSLLEAGLCIGIDAIGTLNRVGNG